MLSANHKSELSIWRKLGLRIAVLSLAALPAYPGVHTTFPPPNAPFYARIGPGPNAIHDEQWAAIPFYTSPDCVPADFNLLNFFDIPRAFGCPLNVQGLSVWKNGPPPIDLAPIQNILQGTGAVHIWFVHWNELQAGLADGVLTVPELRVMPSLQKGLANLYHETLHPPGTAQVGRDVIAAHGTLTDGRVFQLESSAEYTSSFEYRLRNIRIVF